MQMISYPWAVSNQIFISDIIESRKEAPLHRLLTTLGGWPVIMGDDWKGKFDEFKDICQVFYLPRTPSISTTEIVEIIKNNT